MTKRRKASGAGEESSAPAPAPSERETLDASVASLSGLNLDQLRLQWRNHLGGIAPAHLPGWLLMHVLAYRIQATHSGISTGRSCGVCASTGTHPSSPLVPLQPAGRRRARASGSSPELYWSGNGTGVWSESWSSTTAAPGMAASIAAFRRSPRRSQARIGTDTASSG